jgi:aryl carrier-like protein
MIHEPVPDPIWFETIDGQRVFYWNGQFRRELPTATIRYSELVRVPVARRWWEFFKEQQYEVKENRGSVEVLVEDVDSVIEDMEFLGAEILEVEGGT